MNVSAVIPVVALATGHSSQIDEPKLGLRPIVEAEAARQQTAASSTVVDYLARMRWPRVCWVEHKTFGIGTPLYRKQLDNGSFAVVVDYGVIERTLVIDPAHWITPIEKLKQVTIQKVKKFTVRVAWPKPTVPTPKNPYPKVQLDKPWCGFYRCMECGERFLDREGKPRSGFAFCGETYLAQGGCKRTWLKEHLPACEHPELKPKHVDGVIVHSDGERQAKRTAPFTHSRVSEATRALYEAKLFADVATYREKDQEQRDEAPQLKKYAALYGRFCMEFEFPKVHDERAMEKAEGKLIKTVPPEHLRALIDSAVNRGLVKTRFDGDELTFVRPQDLNLATER